MNTRDFSDDFFSIGNIALLTRVTRNDAYDFNFRDHFDCRSVVADTDLPVLLHIGAIEDYARVEKTLAGMGMRLLVSEQEHLRCSLIEKWYPVIKSHTPFTIVYDELPDLDELAAHFSFPVFVKGNRQTSRHEKTKCIIENAEDYERLRDEWKQDPILAWQKAAIREYVPLQAIDAEPYPGQVPISCEFRFFYYAGQCMGYGPYWHTRPAYSMTPEDEKKAFALTDWAAYVIPASFIAIDIAKTASGEWIIIEINDAQESGFAELNPLPLWESTIQAMQEPNVIPIEEFPEGTVILSGEPLQGVAKEDFQASLSDIHTTQDLVDRYVQAHNHFWFIEDDVYDYIQGSKEYEEARNEVEAWGRIMDELQDRLIKKAKEERLFDERGRGLLKQLERFMSQYGYQDGRGWWVPISCG